MKRAFSLVLLLVCLYLIFQFGVTFFKNSHQVDYNVRNNESLFYVNETFENDKYYFDINVEDYNFYFAQNNNFNKMKQVIEGVEFIKNDKFMCVYPLYKDNVSSYILCSDKKQIYTQESLKTNDIVQNFVNRLENDGNLTNENYVETKSESGQITYYPSAIDETIVLWFYQGFKIFKDGHALNHDFLTFDRYENTLSTLVDKYYISPVYENNKLFEFSKVEVFNVQTNDNFTISFDFKISNFSYINGVVDNKLYLFDKNNMQQIEIDPIEKEVNIVGTKDKNALYYNGDWSNKNIYDFVNNEVKFINFDDSELKQKYSYTKLIETDDCYYLYDNNNLYQVYKNNLDESILLFSQVNMKEIKVNGKYIYYILNDTIYKYNIEEGTKRILKYNDLLYNYSNIYDVYKK